MTSLRIVLVMLEPPVPFGNAAARWYYVLLRELVARGHRVTAFATCSKVSEIEEALRLFPAPEYDLRLYPLPVRRGLMAKLETVRRPLSYLFADDLKRELDAELARGYDILHLEQQWCGWVARHHTDRTLLNILYLFSIDLSEVPPHSLRDRILRFSMFRSERRLLRAFPRLATITSRLQESIRALAPGTPVHLIPFGIDASLYPYMPDERRTNDPVIGLIGQMSWYPSRSAAERLLSRLWPEIKRRVPKASVLIVGWGAREALTPYLNLPDVHIHENVPDVRPYFEALCLLLYAPGRGSGIKVKVLEALAFGVPVVTTTEGIEGLPAVDGVHAGIADDDAGLIDRTVKLLTDAPAQNRQRAAGRAMLEASCGPGPTVDAVERLYADMIDKRTVR